MNHKQKKTLGKNMLSKWERRQKGMPWYEGSGWQHMKTEIKLKVARREQPGLIQKLGL